MSVLTRNEELATFEFSWSEATGAVGDSVTVLPIVVGVAVLTDRSLGAILIWFGVFQIVWGAYYGVPMSVEPMKALAALLLAGVVTTGEYLVAGLLAGVVLLAIGASSSLDRVSGLIGEPVIRGVQLAVALVLLETGVGLGLADPGLAVAATVLALAVIAAGYRRLSALVVLLAGAVVAWFGVGASTVQLPTLFDGAALSWAAFTPGMLEASVAQLAMTVGNAAVATALLVREFFRTRISPDELASSMGVMNLVSVPLGGVPMCHGSGGLAGKYAFGARTATANVVLGVAYIVVAIVAVDVVAAYPLPMLGVILALVALQLGATSLDTDHVPFVAAIGVLGLLTNVGLAFVVGLALYALRDRVPAARIGQWTD